MRRGYSIIGLDNPKTLVNVGSVMRGAGCYDVHHVYYSGKRVKFKPCSTDTESSHRHRPITKVESLLDVIPYNCVPVAVELIGDATPIQDFEHPERAYYIFGQEDGSLGKRITDKCASCIYIPTRSCLNLAVAVNTILFDRMMKRKEYLDHNWKTALNKA